MALVAASHDDEATAWVRRNYATYEPLTFVLYDAWIRHRKKTSFPPPIHYPILSPTKLLEIIQIQKGRIITPV